MKTDIKATVKRFNAVKDEKWLAAALWRKENKDWLDLSFRIAVKILSSMKSKGITQKKLAEIIGCSPQYVNKLLKGSENLQLETIVKIEKALGIQLIQLAK